jgi:sialic acid synthase SpsE
MARDLVRIGHECGLDAVKFQLFPNEPKYTASGNVPLPYVKFPSIVDYGRSLGIEVFASFFDEAAYLFVDGVCNSIKFSYNSPMSKYIPSARRLFGSKNVYVSGDIMNPPPAGVQRLYCIPEYPVKYEINFECIFGRFDGFSDHTLGISQTIEAVRCGAKIIEKHFRLGSSRCDNVPDGKFAIKPRELDKLCDAVQQCRK